MRVGLAPKETFMRLIELSGPDAAELHVVKLLEERVGHLLRP